MEGRNDDVCINGVVDIVVVVVVAGVVVEPLKDRKG